MQFSRVKKNLFSLLQKRRGLISSCVMALAILGLGLFAISFANSNIFMAQDIGPAAQDLKINKQLYSQVSEKMREDTERPILGIGGARNPFELE